MKFWTVKKEGKLYPADVEAQIEMNKLPAGEPILIKYTQVRNPAFNRKYWALVNLIFQNLPETVEESLMQNHQFRIKTKEDVHFYIKLKNGFVEKKYIGEDGNIAWVPKSISFDSMDEMEFQDFFDKAVDTACELLTVESDEIMKEIMRFL